MSEPSEEALQRLNRALDGVDLGAPSTTKFAQLETYLAGVASVPASHVVASTIRKAGNFNVRFDQSPRTRGARLFVGLVTDEPELEGTKRVAEARVREGRASSVLLLHQGAGNRWGASWGVKAHNTPDEVAERLSASLGTQWKTVTSAEVEQPHLPTPPLNPLVVPMQPLVLDPRVRRMFRTSVASRPSVMLVGPPGTGKSQLVEELFAEIADDPGCVGMTTTHESYTTTPDESWTVRELVGGDTIDDAGRLRFSPGAVLDAITQDRWLVLDEANRADMDRIFGGLLTWLSGQEVTVGRISGDPGSGPVRLGWSDGPESVVDGLDRLRGEAPGGDPVTFKAGTEWRLIGTYNALDAQRVFRFGLALGRRFAHVPVPAPGVDGFTAALAPHLNDFSDEDRSRISSQISWIYMAHQATESASLGPASFLGMPAYISHGLLVGGDPTEILAEAYLTSVGTWLSRLEDDQLDQLATTLSAPDVLGNEWAWVRDQLSALR